MTLSCVYSEIMFTIISFFQKLIKRGVGIREGGLENFSQINKRGGRLFGTREYSSFLLKMNGCSLAFCLKIDFRLSLFFAKN